MFNIGTDLAQGLDNFYRASGENFSCCCFQNRSLEDRFVAYSDGKVKYFAVYDGHGESLYYRKDKTLSDKHVVLHIRDNLHHYLIDALQDWEELSVDEIRKRIQETFREVDKHMYDNEGLFGCTANIILILGDSIYQINLGDSKSIIYSGNTILSQTIDHKPDSEKERILSKGGMIEKNRVNGMLAMSRAFGDYQLKLVNNIYDAEGPVSCIPEVIVTKRVPGSKFIVATDGLYDGVREDVQYLVNMMNKHTSHRKMVKYLSYFVLGNNDDDDTTVICGNL